MLSQWCLSRSRVDPANGNDKTNVRNVQTQLYNSAILTLFSRNCMTIRSVINGEIAMRIAYGRA